MSEKKIDAQNYLAEILLQNFIKWQRKPLPTCPFWRKEYSKDSPWFKDLAQRYMNEISEIKNLLEIFDISVIAHVFITQKCVGFKRVKKEFQQKILHEIYREQVKFLNQSKCISKQEHKKKTFTKTKSSTRKGKMSL